MVDALGGIDVYSDKTINGFWTDHSVNIKEGMNHMDGKMALTFSRERHSYAEGDNHRVQNQQDVLMAMLKKMMSSAVITNYTSVLKAISGCFETNMESVIMYHGHLNKNNLQDQELCKQEEPICQVVNFII